MITSSVAELLKNPKYTGYQVYNRRARRSRGGRNKPNPPEMWVWSPEPAHEPLIPKWMFDEFNARSTARRGSRDGSGLKNDPRVTRTYRFRRRVLCDCGRRMIGNPRHGITYYRCHPENNNRGRPDKYAGHPATIYMREDLIMAQVDQFSTERGVFGPQRSTPFLADLDTVDDSARQERVAQRQRLQRKLADTVRKQNNVLRQAEDADPTDPFTQGLRQRYNDLETERQTLLATITGLDDQDAEEPDRPDASQLELLDALPHLTVDLHRVPDELLDRLFDLTQLTIQVHYASNEATVKVTLPADDTPHVAELGHAMEEQMPTQATTCGKSAGQSLCASCTCPRTGSCCIHTGFRFRPSIR